MNNTNGWMSRLSKLSFFAVFLAYCVISLGAFTRLTDAGLACPDWSACYSYLAGVLGVVVIAISILSIVLVSAGFSFLLSGLFLLSLLAYQVLLGMWTVTYKLEPIIVTQHLLVSVAIIALLWMVHLRTRTEKSAPNKFFADKKLRLFGWFCFALLFMQIGLGGWTSSHDMVTGLAPIVIQMMHYSGALLVTFSLMSLFVWIKLRCRENRSLAKITHYLLILLFFQIILGGINLMLHISLVVSLLHDLVAVTMLLLLLTINYHLNPALNRASLI